MIHVQTKQMWLKVATATRVTALPKCSSAVLARPVRPPAYRCSWSVWSAHELPTPHCRISPALQLVQASVGRPPNTGALLSPLPLHQLVIDQSVLRELDGVQQLSDFVNYLLKGEDAPRGNQFMWNDWTWRDFFKQRGTSSFSAGALRKGL